MSQSTDSGGEKKKLVILFCDIRGFTAYSETKNPEDMVSELNDYFNEMAKAIVFESGTIDKFIGDAIMAVFGGAIPLDNPCESALNAAVHMRRNLQKLNERRAVNGAVPVKNGIGLHYGEAFIGSLGSSERKDYTVIGDAVNTASRLESLCKQARRDILISEEFYSQLGPDYKKNCEPAGSYPVKGKSEELKVYSLAQIS